jgi:aryl-alcohol dehydrogenase-like predicted oxidoreductase
MQTTLLRPLGKTGAEVPAIGVGTNRWSYGANDAPVFETYQALVEAGGGFVDTAEVYGFGKSERLIGDCLRKDGRWVFVASKFAPFVARTSPRHLMAALDGTLARLGLASVDLYYVHFPFPFADLGGFADGLAEAVKSGKTKYVGVSNFSADQMRRVADRLARSNIPLAANEVHYSLAHRDPETNGVLEACRDLDAALVAYFPLASGRLAGSPADARQVKLDAVRRALAEVAQARQATPSQAALNWLLARDPHVIPIPGATKAHHARDNLGALAWCLTDEEFAALDAASALVK